MCVSNSYTNTASGEDVLELRGYMREREREPLLQFIVADNTHTRARKAVCIILWASLIANIYVKVTLGIWFFLFLIRWLCVCVYRLSYQAKELHKVTINAQLHLINEITLEL